MYYFTSSILKIGYINIIYTHIERLFWFSIWIFGFISMTEALLDVFASTDNRSALEDGELPHTSWSGADQDITHVDETTWAFMEMEFQRALLIGTCAHDGRKVELTAITVAHGESILILCALL